DEDPHDVARVEPANGKLRVTTSAGDESDADAVVVAVGVTPFAYAPPPFELGGGVELATAKRDPAGLAGQRVAVIGGGQNALESAGIAAREGADVELLVRSSVRWFAAREPETQRGPLQRRLYELAYPALGYGPPPLNRIVLHPDLF